jgi:hypothetical protein
MGFEDFLDGVPPDTMMVFCEGAPGDMHPRRIIALYSRASDGTWHRVDPRSSVTPDGEWAGERSAGHGGKLRLRCKTCGRDLQVRLDGRHGSECPRLSAVFETLWANPVDRVDEISVQALIRLGVV